MKLRVYKDEIDRMFAELEDETALARLQDIERDILAGLKERPVKTWCRGCFRLFRTIHAKALGKNWRK